MSETKYKIMAPGSNNCMVATYENGELTSLEGINHMAKMWTQWCLNAPVPLYEKLIPGKNKTYDGLIHIEEIEMSRNDAKIAAFCNKYKEEIGVPYRRNLADISAMRGVDVTDQLLDKYFNNTEWWGKQPKSIRNYAKNYNALMQLLNQPAKKAQKKKGMTYPDHYDREFARRLKGPEISGYWKHLRDQGLKPVKSATGNIIDWTKTGILFLCLLMLSSCMTPNRVKRYLANHPEIVEIETDTVWRIDTLPHLVQTPIPGDTASTAWSWDWNWNDPPSRDTSWIVPAGPHSNITLQVEAKDVPSDRLEVRKTEFRFEAQVAPDTIVYWDTIEISVPELKERVVVVRSSWKTKLLWAGAGALFLLILIGIWQRKK